jgi:hypothetical protein
MTPVVIVGLALAGLECWLVARGRRLEDDDGSIQSR